MNEAQEDIMEQLDMLRDLAEKGELKSFVGVGWGLGPDGVIMEHIFGTGGLTRPQFLCAAHAMTARADFCYAMMQEAGTAMHATKN